MDEALAAQNKQVAENILRCGWHCLHIAPCKDGEAPFTYSIGFTETFGAPEVLVFGLPAEKAHSLLNACASALKGGHAITPDVENPKILSGGYKVIFRRVRPECFGEYLGVAGRYYQGGPFGAVVMFLPDSEHRFPWQAGYSYIRVDEALAIV